MLSTEYLKHLHSLCVDDVHVDDAHFEWYSSVLTENKTDNILILTANSAVLLMKLCHNSKSTVSRKQQYFQFHILF